LDKTVFFELVSEATELQKVKFFSRQKDPALPHLSIGDLSIFASETLRKEIISFFNPNIIELFLKVTSAKPN
jgi:hypothetical protein